MSAFYEALMNGKVVSHRSLKEMTTKVNSIDYLLKPINSQELRKALDKWRELYTATSKTSNPKFLSIVHPWFNGKLKLDIKLPTDDDILVSREKAPSSKNGWAPDTSTRTPISKSPNP